MSNDSNSQEEQSLKEEEEEEEEAEEHIKEEEEENVQEMDKIPSVMSLWQQVQQLPPLYTNQVTLFYKESLLPLEVRHNFADWIESKKWDEIEENNEQLAKSYLDEFLSTVEMVIKQNPNDFIIRVKYEELTKEFRKHFDSDPFHFVRVIKKCLAMEQAWIQSHENQDFLSTFNPPINEPNERTLVFITLKQMTQETASDVQSIQHDQESYILYFQQVKDYDNRIAETRKVNSVDLTTEEQKLLLLKQDCYKKLDQLRNKYKVLHEKLVKTYECLKNLTMEILEKDLTDWLRKQQLHGMVEQTLQLIDDIQKWCSQLAEYIWENRQQIKKLISMGRQLNLADDYIQLNQLITLLLSEIVTRSFIVLKQPNQILKKDSGRFSASVTLLVGKVLNIDKNPPEVTATLISEQEASKLSSTEENRKEPTGTILNNTGTMELIQDKFMTVTFRNMQLKKIKRTERKTSEAVTEEKFALLFNTNFRVLGEDLTFYVWTVSNPVVVTVHGNQECKATATILWDNHFAEPSRVRFKVPDKVMWLQCTELLSCKFQKEIGVPLKPQDLQYLATKIFGGTIEDDFSKHPITWNQFSKENLKGKSFTFWEWFYAILKLTKEHLNDLYKDNWIAGFIGKQQAQQMLQQKPIGTFLLRYSDNLLGGITIAWLGYDDSGSPFVWNLAPYDNNQLKVRSLPQRLQDIEHLKYLFPDVLKSEILKFLDKQTDKNDHMLQFGYVPTTLKDHIQGVSNIDQCSSYEPSPSQINSSPTNDFDLESITNNFDYGADDFNQYIFSQYDGDVKMDFDNLNCQE